MDNTNIYIFIILVILIGLVANYFLNKNKRELDSKNKSSIRPEMSKKNKYLFPEDGFGKMEKGLTESNSNEIYGRSKKNTND